jgi:predicted AAA+ superfamily ATPase
MESILLEDNPHWVNPQAYDGYASREQLENALRYMSAKEVVAIVGARRVGKSSLARLMIKELLKSVSSKNIFFINLEKPAFIPYKTDPSYLETIYEAYLKLAQPNMEEKIYVFLDEVQIFTNWEVFVKSRYENSTIKFIVTGSNSSLLTSTYATVLTGRVLKLSLTSFNFREFLAYKEIDFSNRLVITSNKIAIKRAVDEYLRWGGYYSVFSNDDERLKKELLKNIAEDIILKDIVPRFSVKNSAAIRDLFYYIASNAATTLNYASLAKKLSIDPKTIKEYVDYFEENFLIRRISKYHTKLTVQINSAKKVYLSDNGFLNLGISSERNMGAMLENAVCNHWSAEDVTYLLENKECDFYVGNKLYQVSYTIQDEKTRKRELDALDYFMEEFRVNESVVVTYDTKETITLENKAIKVRSIESFLIEK